MNANDSEVVLSVLTTAGFSVTGEVSEADVILLNTCAIREKAEQRVWQRLAYFRSLRRPAAQRRASPRSAEAARLHGPAAVGEGVIGARSLAASPRRPPHPSLPQSACWAAWPSG